MQHGGAFQSSHNRETIVISPGWHKLTSYTHSGKISGCDRQEVMSGALFKSGSICSWI